MKISQNPEPPSRKSDPVRAKPGNTLSPPKPKPSVSPSSRQTLPTKSLASPPLAAPGDSEAGLAARLGLPDDRVSRRLIQAWRAFSLRLEGDTLARARLALGKFLEGRPSAEAEKHLRAAAEILAALGARGIEADAEALEEIFGVEPEDGDGPGRGEGGSMPGQEAQGSKREFAGEPGAEKGRDAHCGNGEGGRLILIPFNFSSPPAPESSGLKKSIAFSGVFRILVYGEGEGQRSLFADFQADGNPYSFSIENGKIRLSRTAGAPSPAEEAELSKGLEVLGFKIEFGECDPGDESSGETPFSGGIDFHA